MTPKLQLSQSVLSRLGDVSKQREGAVYGTMYDNSLLVLGLSVGAANLGTAQYARLQTHLPTEVDFCGVFIIGDDTDDDHIPPCTLENLKNVLVTDNPLLIKRAVNSSTLRAYFYYNDRLVEAQYQVLSEAELCQRFAYIRLRARVPLLCNPDHHSVLDAINDLQKTVSSGNVAFHVAKTKVYLFGTEMVDSSTAVGQLLETLHIPASTSLEKMEVINVTMLQKATRDALSEDTSRLAPVIHHVKCDKQSVSLTLPVDHLALVHVERKVAELYNVLVDTLCRSLRILERCVNNEDKVRVPRAVHFLPPVGHFVTLSYPVESKDKDLKVDRERAHRELNLPQDRPMFRIGNAHRFREDIPANSPLINPHETLKCPVKDPKVSLVYGQYNYHHYLQDGIQDDGWGCAYRSFQTIFSWFRHQGYTDRPIPSHKEVQQCLVDIGDKPSGFVGSRQWIGSTELNFCLETMLGVSCRILSVSSAAELPDLGPELSRHFAIHGTPVMIGGGVLAHTIIGVAHSRDGEELRYLVLDPHYTGADNLQTIHSKGWVGWKKPDFWTKDAFYNLCLPLRPICF